ncbi:MAG: hypothetical protein R3E89_12905 [Thiolinea sp.]
MMNMMKTGKGLRKAMLPLALLLAVSGQQVFAEQDTAESTLFQLGEQRYTLGDLPENVQQAWFEAELQYFKARQTLIDEALLEMELAKRAKEGAKRLMKWRPNCLRWMNPAMNRSTSFMKKTRRASISRWKPSSRRLPCSCSRKPRVPSSVKYWKA